MDSRVELGLRKILGEQVEVPEPMSRVEKLLKQIAEQGLSGGGGTGTPGRGIQKIEKTSTQGLVDTYTVTYTDNSTSTFTVTNGRDGEDGEDAVVSQINHGTSDTTFELPPNQYHTWGEVTSLTLTLDAETSGQANGYWFSFDSGDTATTLSLPQTVKTDIVVEPNMHYECSIVGNYMTFEEWEASA